MEKRLIEPELIIFDLDGTLIDSSGDIAWAANSTLKELGYGQLTTDTIRENIGWGVKSLLEKLMPAAPPEKIDEAREIFLGHYGGHLLVETRLYHGTEDVLEYFKKKGKKMAVVTNKPLFLSEKILKGFSLSGFFIMVLGGDSVLNKKPHPLPLLMVMEKSGVSADKTVFVGDSAIDCETGKRAGVLTIGAAYGFRGREELKNYGCELIIDSIGELKDMLI